MKLVIADPETGRTQEIVTRELTHREQHSITKQLAKQGIRVEPAIDAFHVLHLWAKEQLSTAQEVTAIGAFKQVTDARIDFHPKRAGAVSA